MGRLGLKERRFLAEILLGFISARLSPRRRSAFRGRLCPGHHSVENFAQAIRAIGEPIHNRTAEEISMAKLLTLLLEVTGLFDMHTRPELILLQKTMVVVEGVARGFDPKLDIWKVADPVVREWIERNLGPVGRIQGAVSGAGELARVLADLPAIASRAAAVLERMEKMTREGVTLSPETIASMGRTESRRESLAHSRPLDDRPDLYRNLDRYPTDVIAMHALCASIAITIISFGGRHGEPDHPQARRGYQGLPAATFRQQRTFGRGRGPGDPPRVPGGHAGGCRHAPVTACRGPVARCRGPPAQPASLASP